MDNGQKLRKLITDGKVTQVRALELFNKGQARKLSISQWKAYLAGLDSARRSPCPDAIVDRMKSILKED